MAIKLENLRNMLTNMSLQMEQQQFLDMIDELRASVVGTPPADGLTGEAPPSGLEEDPDEENPDEETDPELEEDPDADEETPDEETDPDAESEDDPNEEQTDPEEDEEGEEDEDEELPATDTRGKLTSEIKKKRPGFKFRKDASIARLVGILNGINRMDAAEEQERDELGRFGSGGGGGAKPERSEGQRLVASEHRVHVSRQGDVARTGAKEVRDQARAALASKDKKVVDEAVKKAGEAYYQASSAQRIFEKIENPTENDKAAMEENAAKLKEAKTLMRQAEDHAETLDKKILSGPSDGILADPTRTPYARDRDAKTAKYQARASRDRAKILAKRKAFK